jgi:1,4-alpha-glucan branching enzyme
VDVGDRDQSVVSYVRRDGDDHALVVLNLTPVPRERYRVGAPAGAATSWPCRATSRSTGGSGYGGVAGGARVECSAVPYHGHPHSIELTLPPLGVVVLVPERPPAPAPAEGAGAAAAAADPAAPGAPAAAAGADAADARARPRRAPRAEG